MTACASAATGMRLTRCTAAAKRLGLVLLLFGALLVLFTVLAGRAQASQARGTTPDPVGGGASATVHHAAPPQAPPARSAPSAGSARSADAVSVVSEAAPPVRRALPETAGRFGGTAGKAGARKAGSGPGGGLPPPGIGGPARPGVPKGLPHGRPGPPEGFPGGPGGPGRPAGPGGLPGRPERLPHGLPGQAPGHLPSHLPSRLPGHPPGHVPGHLPAELPNRLPPVEAPATEAGLPAPPLPPALSTLPGPSEPGPGDGDGGRAHPVGPCGPPGSCDSSPAKATSGADSAPCPDCGPGPAPAWPCPPGGCVRADGGVPAFQRPASAAHQAAAALSASHRHPPGGGPLPLGPRHFSVEPGGADQTQRMAGPAPGTPVRPPSRAAHTEPRRPDRAWPLRTRPHDVAELPG